MRPPNDPPGNGKTVTAAAQAGREVADYLNSDTRAARIRQRAELLETKIQRRLIELCASSSAQPCFTAEQQEIISDVILFSIVLVDPRADGRQGLLGSLWEDFTTAKWPARLAMIVATITILTAVLGGIGAAFDVAKGWFQDRPVIEANTEPEAE